MPKIKPVKPFVVEQKKEVPIVMSQEMIDMLSNLSQKVTASKVLNGGFDALVMSVTKIEEKVDAIHEAVYHPDDGLFARVKEVEHIKANAVNITKLENDVAALQTWNTTSEKFDEKERLAAAEQIHVVKLHVDQLKDLVAFKARVCTILKWLAVTIGGGLLTGLGKLIYEFVKGHIVIS